MGVQVWVKSLLKCNLVRSLISPGGTLLYHVKPVSANVHVFKAVFSIYPARYFSKGSNSMAGKQKPVQVQKPEPLCVLPVHSPGGCTRPPNHSSGDPQSDGKSRIISFAGGLPNPGLIDVRGYCTGRRRCPAAMMARPALQDSTTEGYPPLPAVYRRPVRKRLGLDVSPEEILITNGSQQCLDLIGKILVYPGDRIAIERPGFLGAIQVFSLYEPVFVPIELQQEGPDPAAFEMALAGGTCETLLWYPQLPEPIGDHVSEERRKTCADILRRYQYHCCRGRCIRGIPVFGRSPPPLKNICPTRPSLPVHFQRSLPRGCASGGSAPHS